METFEVKINEEFTVKGSSFAVENPRKNLLVITGMQEYSQRYAPFAARLNEEGISVYVLDHFGQGLNAASVEEQQQWPVDAWKMIVDALNLKVEELKKIAPTYLMGHSMGSFAVQTYLERYPNTVEKAIIMGSNGPRASLYSVANLVSKITTTKGNWNKPAKLMTNLSVGGYAKNIEGKKTDLDWLSYNEENVQKYIADPYCGHMNTNGFYHEFMKGMNQLYKKKNLANISKEEHILIVSGVDDPVGEYSKGVKDLEAMYQKLGVKDVQLILYPNMRHEILNEDGKDQVIQDILDFIS